MSKDLSVPLTEALLEFERDKVMDYIAARLRSDPSPEFLSWIASQIEEGRITLAPPGKGRSVDKRRDAEVMRFVETSEGFDHDEKMDAMIALLSEHHALNREKARQLIKAGLDLREASEDAQPD
jgi:hypothetical protein